MAQYYQISIDDLKRMYPNLNLDNLHLVPVGGGVTEESLNSQQVILAQDESLVLNETSMQQLVTYQQPTQNTQSSTSTHYIIQQTDDDNSQTTQQQIYYSSEVPRDQLIQQQQTQQQIAQANAQQNLLIQKPITTNQQQQQPQAATLIQQPLGNQNATHQHVIVQPTQHIVLQQQQTPQQQQQTTNQIVMRQMPTGSLTQQRYIYSQSPRTVVYNTQAQATAQPNQQQQQIESPQNRVTVQQQPTRHLIVTTQPQMQANLIYQPPQAQQQTTTAMQQKRVQESNAQTMTASRIVRTPTNTRAVLNQTPKLQPFRGNIRLTTPTTVTTPVQTCTTATATSDKMSPPQTITTTVTKPARRTNSSGRGRGGATARGGRAAANNRTMKNQSVQQQQILQQSQQQQQMRPPVPPLVPTQAAVTQRIYTAVNNSAPRAVGQIPQRMVSPQTPRGLSPNISPSIPCQSNQSTIKYRTPNTTPKTSATLNFSLDLEESIQAATVTKPNDQLTSTPSAADSKPFQTTLTTYSTVDGVDDDKKNVKLFNGRVMPLSEFKRQQQLQRQQQQQQQQQQLQALQSTPKPVIINRTSPAQRLISTPTSAPTTPVPPALAITKTAIQNMPISDDSKIARAKQQQAQHIIQPIANNKLQSQDGDTQKSARMLVILSSGEQRLITFTLPRESCTVQELLEQVGVPFTSKTSIQCVPNPGANIDYVVTVGITVQESTNDLITAAENSLQLTKQQESAVEQSQPVPITDQNRGIQIPATVEKPVEGLKEMPTKLVPGFLAVCTICGYSGVDFAKCERCRRVFVEEPKRVAAPKVPTKTDDDKKPKTLQAEILGRAGAKATFAIATTAAGISQIRGGKVTITTSIRGRGRGVPRIKPAEIEPVILTLSSDDEGDDEKSNNSVKVPQAAPSPPILKPRLPCEPEISETLPPPQDMVREDVADVANSVDQLYTSITCRTIRFGTYRYDPKEKVFFSSKGIKIVAPNCKNQSDVVVLNIQMAEIVKIIAHFSKALSVIFIYTLPTCGVYIRENLDMKSKNQETPYYNPTDRSEPYKRIILQMDNVSEEVKSVIRSIYPITKIEEVQINEASELLIRSCSKDKSTKLDQSSNNVKLETDNIRQILIYPPGKGGIPINTEDYMCLAIDQYLNDVIIDFYLKYLHTDILSEEQRKRTHIFSSFFYNRLTTMTTRQRQTEKDVKLTASQKRHARVKSWTKNVNLFEKDYIIIPINEQSHWFLAIICFARLQGPVTYETNEPVINQPTKKKKKVPVERKVSLQIGSTTITPLSKREMDSVCVGDDSLSERDEAEGDESDLASDESDAETANGNSQPETIDSHEPIKQPLILIFDSLSGASRSRVVATLRDYLTCEYKTKIKEDSIHVFNKFNMPGHCVKVPQQNNFTDCGLYLLQYVEHFYKETIKDYKLPIKQLVNWFETIVVTRKREEISNLLKELVERVNPERLPLPEIAFPTLNGKLVEPELNDEQAEFEEEEMEEEAEEEEEEEMDSLAGGDTEGEGSPEKLQNGERKDTSTTSTLSPNILTLKRSIEQVGKAHEPMFRKTAKLSDTT